MVCPKCGHKESLQDQGKAIMKMRCPSCQRKFQYPIVMNVLIAIILIGSANLIPAIYDLFVVFRLFYFLVTYYALIFFFDVTGLFKRKYY